MAGTRTSRAISGTITSFLQYALIIMLQFALAPVVLHAAGQEVLGAYSFLLQMLTWAALTDLGFGVAISRSLAQAHGLEDGRKRFRAVFTTGRTFYLGSNIVFSLVIVVLAYNIHSLLSMSAHVESQARTSLLLLSAWVAIRICVSLYDQALIATQNLAAVNIIVAVGNVLKLVMSLVLTKLGAGLIGLMMANIVAEALTFAIERWWYRRLFPEDRFHWGVPDHTLFREMLSFGLTYMVMVVASRLSACTDSIIVGYLSGAAAVSIYYTSQVPGATLYQLIWKLTDNAGPAVNELYAKQASAQLKSAYIRLLRYSLLLVFPLSIGLVALNRQAITLWVGPAQYGGDLLTIGLAVFAFTQVITHLNAITLVAYGDVRVMSILSLVTGIAKVILAFWLGRRIGLAGVMLGNTLSDIPSCVYFCIRVWRLLGLSAGDAWWLGIFPSVKASVLTGVVLAITLMHPPAAHRGPFVLWTAILLAAWIIGVWAAGITRDERRWARDLVWRAFGRGRDRITAN